MLWEGWGGTGPRQPKTLTCVGGREGGEKGVSIQAPERAVGGRSRHPPAPHFIISSFQRFGDTQLTFVCCLNRLDVAMWLVHHRPEILETINE